MDRKILLIQSDVACATVMLRALPGVGSEGREVVWAKTLAQGTAWLDRSVRGIDPTFCAVVCDLSLSDCSGVETFDRVFACGPLVPIFVMSFRALQSAAERTLQLGAQGSFLKESLEIRVLVDSIERAIERSDHASTLFEERDRAQVTLEAIADGVISTDREGLVTYCNPVAARLTGWDQHDATGQRFSDVFRLLDSKTRSVLPDPMSLSMNENVVLALKPESLLVRSDGHETAVEDSTAPIHDRAGKVVGAVIVFRDATASRAAALKMSYLAQHDGLTDLPNRFLLADRLAQAIQLAERNRRNLALLFLDIDRFKTINDSLGHAVGDKLLESIARRLVASVRSADTVSRQGGDEFIILLSDVTRIEDVVVAAGKVLAAIALPHDADGHELYVTASVGAVVYPQDGADTATLLKNADAAMYHAKESGRNNIQFFTSDMHLQAVERRQIESDLRRALKLDQLVLHYQPIVELEHSTIVGVEALIRWRHPRRGMLHPVSFMVVAEQSGLVIPMGRWVIQEACRQARAWSDAGFPAMRLAINISALELRTSGFVESVRDSLLRTGLSPRCLEIEITETVLLEESKGTSENLDALAAMGVDLALDDFGTGYSSLSHLKRYPISTVKIDRSFIRELATDANDASIVDAVIGLGRSLGLRVVAEGVESAQQASLLRAQGCLIGQGFHFGEPVDAGSLEKRLGRAGSSTAGAGAGLAGTGSQSIAPSRETIRSAVSVMPEK